MKPVLYITGKGVCEGTKHAFKPWVGQGILWSSSGPPPFIWVPSPERAEAGGHPSNSPSLKPPQEVSLANSVKPIDSIFFLLQTHRMAEFPPKVPPSLLKGSPCQDQHPLHSFVDKRIHLGDLTNGRSTGGGYSDLWCSSHTNSTADQ